MKKMVFIAVVAVLLAVAAQAGEIKVHDWPMTEPEPIPQDVCTINVIMDIGYWIECVNQDDDLKLIQKHIHSYENCMTLEIRSNFRAQLSCSISPTGVVPGDYTCDLDPTVAEVGTSYVSLCVQLHNADLSGAVGGTSDVHVATVTIKVLPAP
jgi:opacity protein-like surface antigen